MKKIDAHHHLWKYSPTEHSWIDDSMSVLKQDFLPQDLWQEMSKAGYEGCVAVQASQTEKETQFLLSEASTNPFILGVIGWVNLSHHNVRERLNYFSQFSGFKGVRHVLQDEEDDQFMLRAEFLKGIACLEEFGLTYDILIFPKHLPYAVELVEKFPNQPFVIDHIAKPEIKDGKFENWADDMHKIASYSNVQCKLSGMVTEADWNNWTVEQLQQYIEIVVDAFGVDRVMIGSDWPVCKLAGEYTEVMQVVESYFTNEEDKEKVLGGNAAKFYGLINKSVDVI
ncbi:amidohydrolase family protein [Flammeovirga agarivorans]|uniref:Amidohydrolase family protein n=1 Tax=Flammeovirga agarivorans TaxID=2726742 RepID=A0A7X8SNA5_9BACT|nr:amidohydrolase family protein [Flammeovirga agarivorans]NLR93327.1 amidohydrolase family protein [Flammeovirga agarivorans]